MGLSHESVFFPFCLDPSLSLSKSCFGGLFFSLSCCLGPISTVLPLLCFFSFFPSSCWSGLVWRLFASTTVFLISSFIFFSCLNHYLPISLSLGEPINLSIRTSTQFHKLITNGRARPADPRRALALEPEILFDAGSTVMCLPQALNPPGPERTQGLKPEIPCGVDSTIMCLPQAPKPVSPRGTHGLEQWAKALPDYVDDCLAC